jgi:hypothetical protein
MKSYQFVMLFAVLCYMAIQLTSILWHVRKIASDKVKPDA